MAHLLDFTKGFAAIAYRGETPWHGYGQVMEPSRTIEEWLGAAGLDFEVQRRAPFFYNTDGQRCMVEDSKVLVRSDNDQPLSIVSDRYNPVQPREVLEFFRDLVSDQGFELETAGALSGGRRIWALARTGNDHGVAGTDDRIDGYLLLSTSYDKTLATTAQFTSVRVVCNNTLQIATDRGSERLVRVQHSVKFTDDVAQSVKAQLGLVDDQWAQFTTQVDRLAKTPISKAQAVEFFMELMGYENEDPAEIAKSTRTVKTLLHCYEGAPGQNLVTSKDTAFGLVNAVTYFADHARRAHDQGTRLNSAWFGPSAVLKAKAFDKAIELAEAA